MISVRQQHFFGVLLLFGLVLVIHYPQTSSDFGFDDRVFIETNQSLRTLPGALQALLQPFPPEQPERGLYRPLTNASYALDYAFWQDRAFGFHLGNVLLYGLLVTLIYRLGRLYRPRGHFAFALALVFAVHPIHTEAVDAIAGRSELLSLLFCVLSLIAFLPAARTDKTAPGGRAVLLSALFYLLACLSKETGAVLIGVLLVHGLVWRPDGGWTPAVFRRLKLLLPHAVVLILYLLLRVSVLGRFSPDTIILEDRGWATRLDLIGNVFLTQVGQICWPSNLQIDYYYEQSIGLHDQLTAPGLLGLGLLLCVCGILAWLLVRRLRRGIDPGANPAGAIVLSGGAIYLCMSFPYLHLLDIGALFAERFTFAPSLGLLIVALALLQQGLEMIPALTRTVLVSLGLATLTWFGALASGQRALEWRHPVLLWQSTATMLPDDERVQLNLAGELMHANELVLARKALQKALQLEPQFLAALGNLGVLSIRMGDLQQAEDAFSRILQIDDRDFLAWYNLGIVARERGQHAEAIGMFKKALALNPNFAHAQRYLADSQRFIEDSQ